jgi:radical SAM-linked protein
LRRAGFPLEYTKGFHPVPKVSFGPPLGVGVAGLSEYFDMEITPPFDLELHRKKLNSMLSEGLYVGDMSVVPAESASLSSFITRYEYRVKGVDISSVTNFLSEKEVLVRRDNREINLRTMVEEARFVDEDTVHLILVDQVDKKVRLGELLPVIFKSAMENLDVTRVALYGWKSGWIKPLERSFQWTAKY